MLFDGIKQNTKNKQTQQISLNVMYDQRYKPRYDGSIKLKLNVVLY